MARRGKIALTPVELPPLPAIPLTQGMGSPSTSATGTATVAGAKAQQRQPRTIAKRYRRSDDLHREHQQRRWSSGNPIAEYSRRNPDEDEAVMNAQWRLAAARAHERSLTRRLQEWWRGWLGGAADTRAASIILDHVFLGSDDNAADRGQLLALGITHICNCATQAANHFEGEFVYLKVHLRDAMDEDVVPHFQTVAKFLSRVEHLRGRALVHCIAGVSRSAALVVAYLMIAKGMPLLDAYNLVRRNRRCVQPNQAFRLQLAKFELMLHGRSSVAETQDKDWNFYAWNEIKSTRSIPHG